MRQTSERKETAGTGPKRTGKKAASKSTKPAKRQTNLQRELPRKGKPKAARWSAAVTEKSDALDLEKNVFKKRAPDDFARSLERSAERSRRRKGTVFQSAMSMLTFYINRAGKNLSASRLRTLDRAKQKLREAFGKAE